MSGCEGSALDPGRRRNVQELLGRASVSATQRYTRFDLEQLGKTYAAPQPTLFRRRLGIRPAGE